MTVLKKYMQHYEVKKATLTNNNKEFIVTARNETVNRVGTPPEIEVVRTERE